MATKIENETLLGYLFFSLQKELELVRISSELNYIIRSLHSSIFAVIQLFILFQIEGTRKTCENYE